MHDNSGRPPGSLGGFASLTAGLLARKGEAQPSAPGFMRPGAPDTAPAASRVHAPVREQSRGARPGPDGGWAGHLIARAESAPPADLSAVRPAPAGQGTPPSPSSASAAAPKPPVAAADTPGASPGRAETAGPSAAGQAGQGPAGAGPKTRDARVGVTVRLSPDEYLVLKLAAAHLDATQQNLVHAAVRERLDRLRPMLAEKCACLRKGRI
jgi:hypothetical protein